MSVTAPPTIDTLPDFPARSVATDEDAYVAAVEAWGEAMPDFGEQIGDVADNVYANALAAFEAAGAVGAFSIQYIFSTTTADADPGAGKLRLNQATQNTATVIRADLLDTGGVDWTAALGGLDDSTSATKGYLKLTNAGGEMLAFSISALATPSGYVNITVSCLAYSSANPFSNGEVVELEFSRTGDKGDTGAVGATGPASGVGRQSMWIPAGAMTPRPTSGAAPGTAETATNKIVQRTLDFDASSIEYAQFTIRAPKAWDAGTVTFKPVWSHPATTTNFKASWALQAVARSDNEALDVAFGTAQTSNDTGGVTDNGYIGPESAAITIANTPTKEDLLIFQVYRVADDGTNDTLAVDARLLGITLYFTTDAGNDA